MKSAILTISLILLFAILAQAETACQFINRTGDIKAAQLAKAMNKLLILRELSYRTSAREMTNVVRNHCKSNPYATDDDLTNLLKNMVDILDAANN